MIAARYKEILESGISRKNIDMVIYDAGNDPGKFRILTDFVLNGKDPLPSRAAWALDSIDAKYPELITPYLHSLINTLPRFSHPGTIRSVLKILTRKNIPVKYQGKLIDQCFEWLVQKRIPVAIKVYSMQIIGNLAELYPELMPELREILENQMNLSSPGFKSRARKILTKK